MNESTYLFTRYGAKWKPQLRKDWSRALEYQTSQSKQFGTSFPIAKSSLQSMKQRSIHYTHLLSLLNSVLPVKQFLQLIVPQLEELTPRRHLAFSIPLQFRVWLPSTQRLLPKFCFSGTQEDSVLSFLRALILEDRKKTFCAMTFPL